MRGYATGNEEKIVVVSAPESETAKRALQEIYAKTNAAGKAHLKKLEEIDAAEKKAIAEAEAVVAGIKSQIAKLTEDRDTLVTNMESRLAKLEAAVTDKTKELSSLVANYTREDSAFRAKEKEWRDGIAANEKKAKELDNARAEVELAKGALLEERRAIDAHFKHADDRLTERLAGIAALDGDLKGKDAALRKREADLLTLGIDVNKREVAVQAKEKALLEKQAKLDAIQIDKDELVRRETFVMLREKDAHTREAEQNEREEVLRLKEKVLKQREVSLKQREQLIKEVK